uniref:OmpP1/FadL family transporter n=1 Tax=Roseicyclus sp. TaxID=1914329 RepID=UPI003F6A4853
MNRIAAASAALLASTAVAQAYISRTDQSMRLMFENVGPSGNYAELSFGTVRPKAGATGIENPLVDYQMPGFGFVHRYSDNLSVGLIYDTPYGAAVRYAPSPGIFNGGGANVETDALTLIGRYSFNENVSAHVGIRALRGEGTINTFFSNPAFDPTQAPSLANPPAFPANLSASSDTGYGFLIGGAYEVPEIALRVALTYHSPISLAFSATEQSIGAPASRPFETEFPESYNLEFQSGVAADTLVFGSVRYQMWDGFNLTVPNSVVPGQTNARYVNFTSGSTTYNLGVGRRINENWSASVSYTHRTPGTTPSDTAL